MRIRRLELTNFRTFGHVVFENIPEMVLLVSPNGRGKSSILEAIAGAKDLVAPYHQDDYHSKERLQGGQFAVWPNHLSPPIKVGEKQAEINLEIEATGGDCDYLRSINISDNVGLAHFVIEHGRIVASQNFNNVAKQLFQFHSFAAGVGFLDYIRPVRFYGRSEVGNFAEVMSDNTQRQYLGDFHRQSHDQQKFTSFKSFVVRSDLGDLSYERIHGNKRDSLAEFRQVFNHFFSPKKFVGYQEDEQTGKGQIVVQSPFGIHDTDVLSDGEKEILHVLAYLFRLRNLSNIVLWDTPELHLNAALESRLFDSIRRVAPRNQYWIASHSLELINTLPLESIFVIKQKGNAATVERASGDDRKTRVCIYRELGAQVGLQLVSTVVVFIEGKDTNSDKRLLDTLVSPLMPGVNFIAGGSCEDVFAAGTRANRLLEEACSNGDFFAIVDRDYREDEEVAKLVKQYRGRVFVWDSHEIQNIFLDPVILQKTLAFLGHCSEDTTVESIRADLKQVATELKDWIAADWIAWEFDRTFRSISRRIGGDDPKGSLLKYTEGMKQQIEHAMDVATVELRYEEKRAQIQRLLDQEQWLRRLPGKQILQQYLLRYSQLPSENYMIAAANLVRLHHIDLPDIARLRGALLEINGNTSNET